ncbi:MAG: hypothetical protein LBI65_03075, partial [Candidatus Symbiothrix sp.]|nr:hypothetical protein [Candidatus Symbiothrix sp.]
KFIDEIWTGPQDNLPDNIAKNKGHNKYYMLPLLLGLLGIFFQVFKEKKGSEQFWVTFFLFFMTGLAIVVYLNQYPFQPRERDYAYAGSFYAFCIWIGLGTAGIIKGLKKYLKLPPVVAAAGGSLLSLLVPLLMLSQNWDDHNRSKRYLTRDFGYNYLTTCEPNAIIFTNGDNDTFPLWYGQEVEGYRTDVRVCNLSYLQTDWYIDQMKRQAYESAPLPIDWQKYDYIQGTHDAAWILPQKNIPYLEAGRALDWIKSDDLRTKQVPGTNQEADYIPTDKIIIPVDSAKVIESGLVKPENAGWIPPFLLVDLGQKQDTAGKTAVPGKRHLGKHEIMILDMLKNNSDWSRPIYYAITVSSEQYLRLEPYFRQDGMAYRIMPFEAGRHQSMDADVVYDNLMNKYRWGNLEEPGLYMDENAMRMSKTFRILFGQLAKKLVEQEDTVRTKEALDYSLKVLPAYNVPYDFPSTGDIAEAYSLIGEKDKATELYKDLAKLSLGNLNWYSRLNNNQYASILTEVQRDFIYLQSILLFFHENNEELYEQYITEYEQYARRYEQFMQRTQQKAGGLNR